MIYEPWFYMLAGLAGFLTVVFGKRAFAMGAGGAGATQDPVPPPSWEDLNIGSVQLGTGASAPGLISWGPSGNLSVHIRQNSVGSRSVVAK